MAEFRRGQPSSPEDDDQLAELIDGEWQSRPAVANRIKAKLESALPDENVRTDVAKFLAFAIENADEERENAGLSKRDLRAFD